MLAKLPLPPRLVTVLSAVLGSAVFWSLGLPLPFLFGPLCFSLLAALGGARLAGLGAVSTGMRTILGLAAGCAITPEVLRGLPQMGASLVLVPVFLALVALVGVPFFRRVGRLDPVTAWYAAMPGGLQDMLIFGIEAGGNARALSLIHATRVLIIVAVAPLVLWWLYGVTLDGAVGVPAAALPWHEMAIMAVVALVGWRGGEWIGLFGASILGPMLLAAGLTQLGVLNHRPPAEAILAAQFFIGMSVGVHYVGITLRELWQVVSTGVAFVAILAVLSAATAEVVTLSGLAPPVEAFLAFAPGGQAEMVLLAIIVGADVGFVVTHHMLRMVLVITFAPIVARWVGAGPKDKG